MKLSHLSIGLVCILALQGCKKEYLIEPEANSGDLSIQIALPEPGKRVKFGETIDIRAIITNSRTIGDVEYAIYSLPDNRRLAWGGDEDIRDANYVFDTKWQNNLLDSTFLKIIVKANDSVDRYIRQEAEVTIFAE